MVCAVGGIERFIFILNGIMGIVCGEVQAGDGIEIDASGSSERNGVFGVEIDGERVGGIVLKSVVYLRRDAEMVGEPI